MKRFKDAFRTNEPQATSVLMFTALNLCAAGDCGKWWVYLLAIMFWPTLAFLANLIKPIPE